MSAVSEFAAADEGVHYVFKTFPDDKLDDPTVTTWLNGMYNRGYEINTFQEVGRLQFFVMEQTSGGLKSATDSSKKS